MTIRVVLADANELVPRTPRDYILCLAEIGLYDVRWSDAIWDEVARNLITKFGFSQQRIDYLSGRLEAELPHQHLVVPPEIEYLASLSGADSKDEHVVAAALAANADVLLTENLRDFPQQWLHDRGIALLNLGALLVRTAELFPEELLAAHNLVMASTRRTREDVLANLTRTIGDDSFTRLVELLPQAFEIDEKRPENPMLGV